jgi:hypothetical protein
MHKESTSNVQPTPLTSIGTVTNKLRSALTTFLCAREVLPEHISAVVWSALDVLEDTELACTTALEKFKSDCMEGEQYLLIYGSLQVLFAQQDAARHLRGVFGLDDELPVKLKVLREVRNSGVGHPAKRGKGNTAKSNFIIRSSMRHGCFTLMTEGFGDELYSQDIDLSDQINVQIKELESWLREIHLKLCDRERSHRERFRESRLSSIFPSSLDYYARRLSTVSDRSQVRGTELAEISVIREALAKLKKAVAERGIVQWEGSDFQLHANLVEHCLARLHQGISLDRDELTDLDISAYGHCLVLTIGKLQRTCEDVDSIYDEEP